MDEATIALRRLAAIGLPGSSGARFEVEDAAWVAFRSGVVAERLTGLATEAIATGLLRLPDRRVEELEGHHREAMLWALRVERRLLRVAAAMDGAGVPFVVLKGAALAHTVYPEPCLRSFADLDVLVGTRDWRRACEVLRDLGLRRRQPEPRRGFDERFGKASVHKGEDGVEGDLHRTLVVGPFGLWLDPEELLSRTETFEVGGRTVLRLDDTGLLLNACMHASLGWWPPRLVPLRDVLQVARHGEVDWDVLARWAARWRLAAVLQHAFMTASETLGAPMPEDASAFMTASPPRTERRALAAYAGRRRQEGGTALGTMRAIPGLRRKAAYALALAFPSRAFLEARTGTGVRPSYWRRLKIPVGWARSKVAAPHGTAARSTGGGDG